MPDGLGVQYPANCVPREASYTEARVIPNASVDSEENNNGDSVEFGADNSM